MYTIFTFVRPSNIQNFQVAYFMKWALKTLSILQYLEVLDMQVHKISANKKKTFKDNTCKTENTFVK